MIPVINHDENVMKSKEDQIVSRVDCCTTCVINTYFHIVEIALWILHCKVLVPGMTRAKKCSHILIIELNVPGL